MPTSDDPAEEPLIQPQISDLEHSGTLPALSRATSNYSRHARPGLSRTTSSYRDGEEVDESAIRTAGTFVWALTLCAGISGVLFGYDTGVISSALVTIKNSLSNRALTTLDKSLITSSTSLFALLASPIAGLLADSYGRKPVVLVADVLFVTGSLIQALAHEVWTMVLGRSVVGLAVGAASFVVPLYISELSPSPIRGRLVTISALLITFGQVVAYLVGYFLSTTDDGWRWMVGLGAVPAALQFMLLGKLPETPRWLVKAGRTDMAHRVLRKVYGLHGGHEVRNARRDGRKRERVVEGVLRRVEREVEEEEEIHASRETVDTKSGSWRGRVQTVRWSFHELLDVGASRRALVIACVLQGLQQLCGFNSLMYFSATIFLLAGFSTPTLTALSIAGTNFAFTLVAFSLIDRVGRRRILLSSIPVMVLGLVGAAVAFSFLDLGFGGGEGDGEGVGSLDGGTATGGDRAAKPLLLTLLLYVAAYATGLGTVPWQQSELFPLPTRALGSALATATNWGSNFLVGLTFLPLMEALGPSATMALYALVCAAGWAVVWGIYPETAGLGLEEVRGVLEGGWGVRESVRGFGERRGRDGGKRAGRRCI
ncbi:general substrate transporter [Patellaria atrata CBS 101060]|uniref:General substrate transporter n=1 Tax=Patellaria atrata CBS 101060 TaxID=1346257 RepID=A0A9P4SF18_9PEZI|nr:general substrate transporter [Patellaria atrata CBS 101060]